MKKMFLLITLLATSAFANDGGIASIKVDAIRMREFKFVDGKEVITNRIAAPSHKILIEGAEAKKLQKILPSVFSVITAIQPDLKAQFDDSFKSLGIYSNDSQIAKGKALEISCSDADLVSLGNDKYKVVKNGKPSCTITINSNDPSVGPDWGDSSTFEPKVCK